MSCGLVWFVCVCFYVLWVNGTCSVRALNRTVWYTNIMMVHLDLATEFGQIKLVYRAPGFALELTRFCVIVAGGQEGKTQRLYCSEFNLQHALVLLH